MYPLQHGASDAQEQELSSTLLALSNKEGVISLTVMGTPTEKQAHWLRNEKEQKFQLQIENPKDLWTLVTTTTVSDLIHFGIYLFHQGVSVAVMFTRHCFDKFCNFVSVWMMRQNDHAH